MRQGEPLVQRDDDTEETVRKRLQVYHEQTSPLVSTFISNMTGSNARCLSTLQWTGVLVTVED